MNSFSRPNELISVNNTIWTVLVGLMSWLVLIIPYEHFFMYMYLYDECWLPVSVFEPKSIRLQMVFEKWIMLKMFLAALASGQSTSVCLSVCLPVSACLPLSVFVSVSSMSVFLGLLSVYLKPVLNRANCLFAEHISDSSTNYASFLTGL